MRCFQQVWARRVLSGLSSILVAGAMLGVGALGASAQDGAPPPKTPAKADSETQAPAAQAGNEYSQTNEEKRGEAYYDFAMGRFSEQMYEVTGRTEYANDAVDYYTKALTQDPGATAITERLAETYAKSQRIREAVAQAQSVLKQDPDNVGAHRLLARLYVRTLGELTENDRQKETLGLAMEQFQAILRIEPQDLEASLWLARLYRFENEHEKAEALLREVLKREPGDEPALDQLSQLLLDQGRAQEAIALLAESVNDESSPALLDLLGDAYNQTHNYAKAEDAYGQAVKEDPEEVSHRKGLAQALLSQDKFAEAAAQYQKLTQLEPDTAENYLHLAQVYRRLNKLDLAESNLLLAKQHGPGNLEVLYNEALLYETQGRLDDAAHVLTDAIAAVKARSADEGGPNAMGILYELLGRIYREQENYPAAVRTFQELGNLSPAEEKRARLLVIETYRANRELDRALAETDQGLKAEPQDQTLQVTRAMLLGEKGETEGAVKILQSLLKGKHDDQETYLNLAQIEERGHKYAEAEKAASTAEQMAQLPGEKSAAWFMLGAIYELQKKYDQAEEEFRKVLAADGHNAPALNYYGYMLADRGVRLDEAVALIQRALAEEPGSSAYLDSLGWAYYKQNHLAEAEQTLERAAARSHDPTILEHLGDVYAKLGRTEQAAENWEKAQSEWQHALPADYEAERVAQLDQKVQNVKRRLAQKSMTGMKPE
jgi:tetratricopeptide (TPR) repeat protein